MRLHVNIVPMMAIDAIPGVSFLWDLSNSQASSIISGMPSPLAIDRLRATDSSSVSVSRPSGSNHVSGISILF